ncbi:hypothetical protein LCGC14_0738660 [marine sediment metagenome]|uniref:SIS domain-containing protein n=1 Tax=marine sediment metagenome TaxID=412755 RepID=A0A0F9SSB1_9ZZZZ
MLSEYLAEVRKALHEVEQQEEQLRHIAKTIGDCQLVHIMGNGGSASTAQHFAQGLCDLGIPALCFSDNSSLLTAISNDQSYEDVFSKQSDIFCLTEDDVTVVISASGNSENILRPLGNIARDSVGLLGFGGGKAADLVGSAIILSSQDYGVVEDVHLVICHLICRLIKNG